MDQSPSVDSAENGHDTRPGEPAPVSTFPDSRHDPEDIHLMEYVRILYKRRSPAATVFVVSVLSSIVYSFTATPLYEAQTQLLIESDKPNVISFKEVINQTGGSDYYQTQYRILQSRSLAKRTLDALQLWNDPRFGGAKTHTGVLATKANVFRVVGSFLRGSGSSGSAELPGPDETEAQSRAIDRLLSGLTISPVRTSRLVEIKYTSPDPYLAARIANAYARAYIDQNLEFKFLASKEASDWLGERLAEQRKKVETSEKALQRYREQNDAMSLEERQNIVVQKLADLNAVVTKAKAERIEKQALYEQVRAARDSRAELDVIPQVLSNTFIQQLKTQLTELQRQQAQLGEKLGPRHPEMAKVESAIKTADARLHAEITKVVAAMRNDFQTAQAQERSLLEALDAQKHEAMALNRKGIDYGALQRDAAANRQLFESLMQRTKETGVAGELKSSNIHIVDAAELPRAPVSPHKTMNILLAVLVGSVFGCGVGFFFEYLDNRIKSPEEVTAELKLTPLGLIPKVASYPDHGTDLLLNNGVPADFAEAFRTIRTNVLFSSTHEGPRSVVVTSTGPGEGKTVVAANLTISLAQIGQRVLLIDADMRRPRANEFFGLPHDPGLSNVLVGNAQASEAISKTSVPGLWVLPSGRIPPNPADLLTSLRFQHFLKALYEHFDWVIIDSPPVMPVTDACLIGHLASAVLFVVGCEMTDRGAARAAVKRLNAAKVVFMGAVLNSVDFHRNAYYYAPHYRREYAAYLSAAN